jgi:phosphopantothenoylcysteine decarboxylase / phosphopantothenate---cysteine ligase
LKNSLPENNKPLLGKRILVNAGPTREHIDPVRFISNHSTGKMGVALAEAAASMGAAVDLVLGPVSIRPSHPSIEITDVVSAADMARECIRKFADADIAILAAAISDFTPENVPGNKIKRGDTDLILKLRPTKDIAAELGKSKSEKQLVVGFALETENEIENATAKLKRKNLNLIVLNSLRDKGAGFGFDTNMISLIDNNNNIDKFELKSKEEAAIDILRKIISMIG